MIDKNIYIVLISIIYSTIMYYYLHFKTKINIKYLFLDNILVIILVSMLNTYLLHRNISLIIAYLIIIPTVPMFGIILTMIRFYRTPKRESNVSSDYIISPSDGNIIYIKEVKSDEIPFSIKGKTISKLEELTKTPLLKNESWLIGINLTPFDVHKNCAPIKGKIILQKHFNGKFLSLKDGKSITDNERNTFIIQNEHVIIGIVQIASKLVRRIIVFNKVGDNVERGKWIGMITFGSQVDIIIPKNYEIKVKLYEQIYAGKTIIAEPK